MQGVSIAPAWSVTSHYRVKFSALVWVRSNCKNEKFGYLHVLRIRHLSFDAFITWLFWGAFATDLEILEMKLRWVRYDPMCGKE